MNSLSDGFEVVVPLSLVNLVIMEAISLDEMNLIIEKASKLECYPLKAALLLLRVHFILFWV